MNKKSIFKTMLSITTLDINIECFTLSVIMQSLAFFIVRLNVVASLIKLDHLIKQEKTAAIIKTVQILSVTSTAI